ncbi:COG0820 Predicted Fe-S-cluster redox enzyme [uncultured Caudovirales phage]|uniref:COG0820 Predicted Fe-S-cluster redox enzyme n=1 Tax=uncultured Caudovirales phage TaxID=2100421 RepID=A0A6J5RTK8_9CAUD|nr:COG0820 Predicted Fe-S-cluster redox enzyme [uncultured Caudovirales phage]
MRMRLLDEVKSSTDNVIKFIFEGKDKIPLEVSSIYKGDGKDIYVIPTQTSCNMGCTFCHLTGLNIPVINLSADEMFYLTTSIPAYRILNTNNLLISYMGAGEPLLNIDNVIRSARHIQDLYSDGFIKVRFAVSTLIPNKKSFVKFTDNIKEYNLPFKIHWSLHSINHSSRKSLMPNALHVSSAIDLVNNYVDNTNNPVEIHYTLIDGINDQLVDVENISKLINKKIVIKLLKFAPRSCKPYTESSNTLEFKKQLESNGFVVEIYSPPGRDIGSSCGQFILDKYI